MPTIVSILNDEALRLNNRKSAIDNAEAERKRIIQFSTSEAQRRQAYNNLYIVVVLMIFIILIIKMLYQFEIIPDTILDILIVIVISVGVIYCLMLYSDILNRSNMNFSEIEFEKAAAKSKEQKDKEELDRVKSGNLFANQAAENAGKCIGSACCPTDSTYNTNFNICVPNMVPYGIVPTDATTTVGGTTTYNLKYESATINVGTQEIVTNLINSQKYHYCRKTDGTYAWLPITTSNKMLNQEKTALVDVISSDPNFVDTATRTAYVPQTMSTNPRTESFVSSATDIQPFSEKTLFATYV
jgi:hypothetical protein